MLISGTCNLGFHLWEIEVGNCHTDGLDYVYRRYVNASMDGTTCITYLVEHGDPPDQELPDVGVRSPDEFLWFGGAVCVCGHQSGEPRLTPLPHKTHRIAHPPTNPPTPTHLEYGDELLHVKDVRLGDNILDEPIQQVGAVLHVGVPVGEELAEALKDRVEVQEHVLPCDLGHVVERLAGVVTDAGFRVVEAVKNRREEEVEVGLDGRHEADGGGGQRDEPALAVVRVGGGAELPAK